MLAKIAADEGEEGLRIWYEWCWRWDLACLDMLMEVADAGGGGSRVVRDGEEKGGQRPQLGWSYNHFVGCSFV